MTSSKKSRDLWQLFWYFWKTLYSTTFTAKLHSESLTGSGFNIKKPILVRIRCKVTPFCKVSGIGDHQIFENVFLRVTAVEFLLCSNEQKLEVKSDSSFWKMKSDVNFAKKLESSSISFLLKIFQKVQKNAFCNSLHLES